MNFLRPTMLRPPASSGSKVSKVILSDANAAGYAWKYWRRSFNFNSSFGNRPRSYHMHTAGAQKYDERSTNHNAGSNFSVRGFASSPSILSSLSKMHYASCTHTGHRLGVNLMNAMPPMGSAMANTFHVQFSTMPHSTNSNDESGKEDGKQKTSKEEEIDSMPASQKAKVLFKKYGAVFVGTYFGVYWTTLAVFFVTLDFGLLDPEFLSQIFKVSKNMACETADIIGPTGTGASMNEAANAYADEVNTEISQDRRTLVDIISGYLLSWEWTSKYAEKLSDNPHLANLAVAWFCVKFTEPVRLAASVILTPKVAKALGRKSVKA